MSKYKNMVLSKVPYRDITIGMEVVSSLNTPGKVTEKIDKGKVKNRIERDWLTVVWENGKVSSDAHCYYTNVKVRW